MIVDDLADAHRLSKLCQRRYVLAFLALLGFANIYAMRANLSIALVEMTSDRLVFMPNTTASIKVSVIVQCVRILDSSVV